MAGMLAMLGALRPGHLMIMAFMFQAILSANAEPMPQSGQAMTTTFVFARALVPTVNVYMGRGAPGDTASQRTAAFKTRSDADANPDSGTTKSASGVRKLFPTQLIRKWNPNLRVRVASNATMRVAFIGIMILPTRREPPPKHADSGKLLSYRLGITDAMYV